MRSRFPLDRGTVESLGPWRATFEFAKWSVRGEPWRGFLVNPEGLFAVDADTRLWSVSQVPRGEPWLMGRTPDGVVHLAWKVSSQQETLYERAGARFLSLTEVGEGLPDSDSLLAAQAVALVRWHERDKFCARCGQRVRIAEAGWASFCPHCKNTEYPRIDMAVIVLVIDDQGRVLLAHNTKWRNNRMSLPAGFVEAGETPRRAVHRETLEEVGVDVTNIEFLGAQPWPGPRSLMLAFSARVSGENVEPVPDGEEIDYARFFTRQEYEEALRSGTVTAPRPAAIANAMLAQWLGKPLPSPQER